MAALLLLASTSSPLLAQQLTQSFASLRYSAPARDSVPSATLNLEPGDSDESPTYWVEGALIVGALIGGQIKKGDKTGEQPDST